ncbi:uncharacterized protein PAC_00166 [Phialocephala subalpina]|uniref:Uncharacterized protein n=1 Tax=Phialocephala subalpina TaxID=576137 RepID=A0A1L7WC14_9HELO|nr:uncharacterized protein PAC_00166 [Phialocephala subalpina]
MESTKIKIRLPQKDAVCSPRVPPPGPAMPPNVGAAMDAQPNDNTITVDRPPPPPPPPPPPSLAPPATGPVPITLPILQRTLDDTAYESVYARVPDNHKLDIDGLSWIKVDPYRVQKIILTAWYSQPRNSYDVVQASKSLDVEGKQQRGRVLRCCSHCNNFVAEKTKTMKELIHHLRFEHNVNEKSAIPKAAEDPFKPMRSREHQTRRAPDSSSSPNAAGPSRSRSYASSQPDFVQQALQYAASDERERAASSSATSISTLNVQGGLEHLLGELGRIKAINEGLMVRSRLNEELAHECKRLREKNERLEERVQESERLRERNQLLEGLAKESQRLHHRNQLLEDRAQENEELRERVQELEGVELLSERLRERNRVLADQAKESSQESGRLRKRNEELEGLAKESQRLRERNQILEQQVQEKTWEVESTRDALSLLASSSSRQQRDASQNAPASKLPSRPTSNGSTPAPKSQGLQVVINSKLKAPSPKFDTPAGKRKPMDESKAKHSKRSRSDSGSKVGNDG